LYQPYQTDRCEVFHFECTETGEGIIGMVTTKMGFLKTVYYKIGHTNIFILMNFLDYQILISYEKLIYFQIQLKTIWTRCGNDLK